MHYVVGDVHGCYDKWEELQNCIESEDNNAKYIFVGDIIDRGNQTLKMLYWGMKNIDNSSENSKYRMILGNHELLKIDWYRKTFEKAMEITGRENSTLGMIQPDQYKLATRFVQNKMDFDDFEKAVKFFESLPLYIDITVNGRRFVIVHAMLPYTAIEQNRIDLIPSEKISEDTRLAMVWERGTKQFDGIEDVTIIHGHTPTIAKSSFPTEWFWMSEQRRGFSITDKLGRIIYIGEHRINIDCGAVYQDINSRLAAIRLEDLKEFYVDCSGQSKEEKRA